MREFSRLAFGDYMPDRALLVNEGLAKAENTVPIAGGYDSIQALVDLATFGTIDERPRGAIAGIDPAGNPFNFVGTETKLWTLQSTSPSDADATSDVTGSQGPYNCRDPQDWEFSTYGKHIIAVNPNDDPQYFTIGESTVFKRLGNPDTEGTFAPRAKTIGTIGTFVVLGNTYDRINGIDEEAIHWSALLDPFNWPNPRSEVAVAVQSDRQPLSGNGGAVLRVVSGAEVAAIMQERAIWRADYRGGGIVFELNRVEPNRGLLIPSVAVPFGRYVFYLAEDGFYVFDYTTSQPIGREIVDQTFLADVDSAYFHRVSATADPNTQRIRILYPGAGNTGGVPNKELVYDWGLNRWSGPNMISAEWITPVIAVGVTLDSVGTAGDPDAIDTAGLSAFDERQKAYGALQLGAWSVDKGGGTYKLQAFTGDRLAGVLQSGRRELAPGRRSMVTGLRPLVDDSDTTLEVAALNRANFDAPLIFSEPARIEPSNGQANMRVDGRYHVFRTNLKLGWRNALALDVDFQQSGTR